MNESLAQYVIHHADRGPCQCGRCIDAPDNPQGKQPVGHTADMVFFKVRAINDPTADDLRRLIESHTGCFGEVDLLDGQEHGYLQVGGWIGDQGLALMLMGLGNLVGLWDLMTPKMLPGLPDALVQQMAGSGMITIRHRAEVPA